MHPNHITIYEGCHSRSVFWLSNDGKECEVNSTRWLCPPLDHKSQRCTEWTETDTTHCPVGLWYDRTNLSRDNTQPCGTTEWTAADTTHFPVARQNEQQQTQHTVLWHDRMNSSRHKTLPCGTTEWTAADATHKQKTHPEKTSHHQQSIVDQQWCQTGYWKEAESLWNKKKDQQCRNCRRIHSS